MIKNLFDTIELKFNTSYEKWNHIIQVETKNSYFKNNKKFQEKTVKIIRKSLINSLKKTGCL